MTARGAVCFSGQNAGTAACSALLEPCLAHPFKKPVKKASSLTAAKPEARPLSDIDTAAGRDWSNWRRNRRSYILAWGLPTALLIIGIFLPSSLRVVVWTGSLVWMGAACLANAALCGRTHCHVTGPFFLLMALATLLHGTGTLSFGDLGWLWIGLTIAAGTIVLWVVPERIFGKFRGR